MHLGAARIDITPDYPTELGGYVGREQPAVGVRHRIFVRAAVFESNDVRLAILSAEVMELPRAQADEARRRVAAVLDTTVDHVCFSATHTHYAPSVTPSHECGEVSERFQRDLADHLCRAAKEARRHLAPARLTSGEAPLDIGRNRRNADGEPRDDTVRVLAAMGEDDRPRLMIVIYACHPVCLSPADRRISGDFCGVACTTLEARHEGCTTLFLNGCAGDINPDVEFRKTPQNMERAGRRMVDAVSKINFTEPSGRELAGRSTLVELRYEQLDPDDLRRQLEEVESLDWPEVTKRAKRTWLTTLLTQSFPDAMPVALQYLRLGGVEWLTLSGEVLWGIHQQIAKACPRLWIAAYCNGGHGYIPTGQAQEEGGYEPDSSNWYFLRPPLVRGAGETLAEAAIAFTHGQPA